MKKFFLLILFTLFSFNSLAETQKELQYQEGEHLDFVCTYNSVAKRNSNISTNEDMNVKFKRISSLARTHVFYIFRLTDKRVNLLCQTNIKNIDEDMLKLIKKANKKTDKLFRMYLSTQKS